MIPIVANLKNNTLIACADPRPRPCYEYTASMYPTNGLSRCSIQHNRDLQVCRQKFQEPLESGRDHRFHLVRLGKGPASVSLPLPLPFHAACSSSCSFSCASERETSSDSASSTFGSFVGSSGRRPVQCLVPGERAPPLLPTSHGDRDSTDPTWTMHTPFRFHPVARVHTLLSSIPFIIFRDAKSFAVSGSTPSGIGGPSLPSCGTPGSPSRGLGACD